MGPALHLRLQRLSTKYVVRIPHSCWRDRFANRIAAEVNKFTEHDDARVYETNGLSDSKLFLEFSTAMRGEVFILCAILRIVQKVLDDNHLKPDPPEVVVPDPKDQWLDHSIRPIPGMLVEAYFGGELQRKRVDCWAGNDCVFRDGSVLHWNNSLGFTYR